MDLSVSAVVFLFLSHYLCVAADRKHNAVLSVPNGAKFGTWGKNEFCPKGYANGFSLKVHSDGDMEAFKSDFSLKGIRLHCTDGKTAESTSASTGKWTAVEKCPRGNLVSFSLTMEVPQGLGVEKSAHNIQFLCSDGAKMKSKSYMWGRDGPWSKRCPTGFICGIQTKVVNDKEIHGKTELHDVQMFCCD